MAKLSVSRTLQDARLHEKRGDLTQAQGLYEAILQHYPDNPRARQALKTLSLATGSTAPRHPASDRLKAIAGLIGRGQFAAAARDCEALSRSYPSSFVLWNLYGVASQQLGRTDAAFACFERAAKLGPAYPDARYNLGYMLQRDGRLEEAAASYRAAVAIRPDYAEALNNLGYVTHALGRFAEAEEYHLQALKARPGFAEAENNLGNAQSSLGRLDDAAASYRRALALRPGFAQAWNNLGNVLQEQGKLAEAVEAYEAALARNPDYAEAQGNLGLVLLALGRTDEAIAAQRKAIALAPGMAEAHCNLGIALAEKDLFDEAATAYRTALSLRPDHAKAANNLGIALQSMGLIDEADRRLPSGAGHRARQRRTACSTSRLATRLEKTDPVFARMQALHAAGTLADAELCPLNFALANVHDKLGETRTAFDYLREGNALRKRLLGYDIAQDRALFHDLRKTAPALDRAGPIRPDTAPEVTPIFIVGMPRSGTTLIEQIVSSHPEVTGGGELDFAARLGEDLAQGKSAATPSALVEFRQKYLARIATLADGRRFVTDKTPHNFLFLGLIANALPEARIIHVSRDPAATCWSNYWSDFNSRRLGYCDDLADLTEHYALYRDLMAFWSARYPGRLQEVSYDALTEDQDARTRQMIAGLGLDWSDDCLAPEANRRAVRTAANLEVRKAVYRGSNLKWLRYAPYLQGAFDRLEDTDR